MSTEVATARRFFARNMNQAMRLLSQAYGKDAVIVSSRQVDGGVELYGLPAFEPQYTKQQSAKPQTLTERRRNRRMRRRQLGGYNSANSPDLVAAEPFNHNSGNQSRPERVGDLEPDRVSLQSKDRSSALTDSDDLLEAADGGNEDLAAEQVAIESLYVKDIARKHYDDSLELILDEIDANQWQADKTEQQLPTAQSEAGDFESASRRAKDAVSAAANESDAIDNVDLGKDIADLKQRLHELELKVGDQAADANEGAMIQTATQIDLVQSGLLAMGLSEPLASALAQSAIDDGQEDPWAAGLLRLKQALPIFDLDRLEEGIYAVTGGRQADQVNVLAKFALYLATDIGVDHLCIMSSEQNYFMFSRFSRMTGIAVHCYEVGDMRQALTQHAQYSHVLVDIGLPGLGSAHRQGVLQSLAELRDLQLGHHEVLALSLTAKTEWLSGQVNYWSSDSTRFCLLNETKDCDDVAAVASLLLEKSLPVAATVQEAMLPDSINVLTAQAMIDRMLQSKHSVEGDLKEAFVPLVH